MENKDGLNGAGSCSLIKHDPHLFNISRLIVIQDESDRIPGMSVGSCLYKSGIITMELG